MTVINRIESGSVVDIVLYHKKDETCSCKPLVGRLAEKVAGRYIYTTVITHK